MYYLAAKKRRRTVKLDNLHVVDLCRGYPPALATMYLADFGADVVKIDPTGHHFPAPAGVSEARALASYALDRNKRSVQLDLRAVEGREIALRLLENADVLLENSRPGAMQRLGLDYETVQRINPGIIYCSVSGFGQEGPYAQLPAHEAQYLGLTGALDLIGPRDGPPVLPSNLIADMAGGAMHALVGILLALLDRARTGKGQFVDIAYCDGVFALLSEEVFEYTVGGVAPQRGYTASTGGEPYSSVYQAADGGYITLQPWEPAAWARFCHAVGRTDLVPRQYPATEPERQELFARLSELFRTKTREEWWNWAQANGVILSPVRSLVEAMEDPQLHHRGMILELQHPRWGPITQVGNPFKLSAMNSLFRRFAPMPGQHTVEILREAGYSETQIAAFQRDGTAQ